MPTHPAVSVIIPVYNGERFLAEAIRSVLDQTLPPDEIIVIDDGSTDGTARIVADLAAAAAMPICYVYQGNQGPGAARNTGIRLAKGDFFAFQDADDVWAADRLLLQMRLLDEQPGAVAVLGRTSFFFTGSEATSFPGIDDEHAPRWFLGIHCGLYRRLAFDKVGLFDNSLRYHEDIDWFRRLLGAGLSTHSHQDVVLHHRRHAGNMTNDRDALQLALLRMLRQARRNSLIGSTSLLTALTGEPLGEKT